MLRCSRLLFLTSLCYAAASPPDVQTIIERSVATTNADWNAAPKYDFTEQDRSSKGSVTYRVRMIDGSQYYEKTAINGRPLSVEQARAEQQKLDDVIAKRRAESSQERAERIAKYQAERRRDHLFMSQITQAFDFSFVRQETLDNFRVWVLRATPKPGYRPPNMESQALRGKGGTRGVGTATHQMGRGEAHGVPPVADEGGRERVGWGKEVYLGGGGDN